MGVGINLYMLMKEIFPSVPSAWPIAGYPYDVYPYIITCISTLAADDSYFMQL